MTDETVVAGAPDDPHPQPMRTLVVPALAVTLLGLAVHGTTFVVQLLLARYFGAGAEVDAYLAAGTLPQYLVTVLAGTLPVVFIPVVAGRSRDEVWRIAAGTLAAMMAITAICAVLGMVFASPLLHATAPGLPVQTHAQAVRIAWIVWPTVVASAVIALVTGASHAVGRFNAPGVAGIVASLINVVLVVATARRWGIEAAAAAGTIAAFLQMAFLIGPLLRKAPWRGIWSHPGVREIFVLLWPLALANILIRSTTVIERYLASDFSPGTITHVTFASRILTLTSFLLASGMATVVFPGMAQNVASGQLDALRGQIGKALRTMWLAVAPAMTIGFALALPAVVVVFQRGRFTREDSEAVAALLRIYLLSLAAGCLATITGRILYALKLAGTIATVGAIEAALYVAYTFVLVGQIGVEGLAWGFVLYMSISFAWQIVLIGRRVGWSDPGATCSALLRTMLAALVAGLAAKGASSLVPSAWAQLLAGMSAGLAAYGIAIFAFNAPDAAILRKALQQLRYTLSPRS